MRINKDTYELVFIDYLDGHLTDREIADLIEFLDQNPELEAELKTLSDFSKQTANSDLAENNSTFLKDSLKRLPIIEQDSNFEELCIAFYEGQLNGTEEHALLELIDTEPELQITFEQYAFTKIKADKQIQFPNKHTLKKSARVLWPNYLSYAASVFIVLGAIYYFNQQPLPNSPQNQTEEVIADGQFLDYPKVGTEPNAPKNTIQLSANETNTETKSKLRNPKSKASKDYNSSTNHSSWEQILAQPNTEKSNINQSYKGKLIYISPAQLQNMLQEKGMAFQDEDESSDETKPVINDYSLKPATSPLNLATSVDPSVFQKQILGSQPPK